MQTYIFFLQELNHELLIVHQSSKGQLQATHLFLVTDKEIKRERERERERESMKKEKDNFGLNCLTNCFFVLYLLPCC